MAAGDAGISIDADTINETVGELTQTLFATFARIRNIKKWLDGLTVADLQDAGVSEDGAVDLKSALADLDDLAALFEGGESTHVTGTYDFQVFPRRLIGIGDF